MIEVSSPRLREAAPAEPSGADTSRSFYRWGGALSNALINLRRRYDGDLDQFLIHLVLKLAEIANINAVSDAKAKGLAAHRRPGVNVQSLSDITQIPRESVRRKLGELVGAGLAMRTEDGLFQLGPTSDVDRLFEEMRPLLPAEIGRTGRP